jgi:hypothetical protein
MATRLKELQWRTFDQLMDEVRIDLYSFAQDGSIQPAQLIKVVQRVNKELGLKIHKTKETILDVCDRGAKLPADFEIANFAMVCHHWKDHVCNDPGYPTGYGKTESTVFPDPTLTTCPCWSLTVSVAAVQVPVTYCDGTTERIALYPNEDLSAKTYKMCLMAVETAQAAGGVLVAEPGDGCYYDYNTSAYSCTKPSTCPICDIKKDSCNTGINPDPYNRSRCYTVCDKQRDCITVISDSGLYQKREYTEFEPLLLVPGQYASAFTNPARFPNGRYQGEILNGFIRVNNNCHKIYLNYQGIMEDDYGNLMVLDHAMINEYYEYAVKKRILENLYINGDPALERRLQLVTLEYDKARANALSIVNTPEVSEMVKAYSIFRKTAEYKYFNPFNKYYSNIPGLPTFNAFYIG